jgi:DNA mismatch repair protein MutS
MSIAQDYLDYTQQWKKEYGEKTLVLIQVGSFFECYSLRKSDGSIYGIDSPYGSNIEEFASINDMIIANKNSSLHGKQLVMAGVGVAYVDKYLKRLQEHGYTIVIYSQDVNAKNTTRSLSEIISPGTFFSPDTEELSNNVMCVWLYKSVASKYNTIAQVTIGVANIDIFTGKTSLFQFSSDYSHNPSTYDELERYISAYKPSECLLVANMPEKVINDIIGFVGLQNTKMHKVDITSDTVKSDNSNTLSTFAKNAEKQIYQKEILKKFYPHILEQDSFQTFPTHFIATQAFCFLLDFVYQHSPNLVKQLAEPVFENYTDKLVLANHSLYQLNMIDDSRHTGKLRSVSSLLNNCVTTMGKRQFLYNLHNPTTNDILLNASYDITEHLLHTPSNLMSQNSWQILRSKLTGIKDIEKLHRKLIMNKVCPKDFAILVHDLQIIASVYEDTVKDSVLTAYINNHSSKENIQMACNDIINDLQGVFSLEKSMSITDINGDTEVFINPGISSKIDLLVKESMDGREKLEAIRLYLSNIIKLGEKASGVGKDTQYIKIHETPKSDAILLGTSRRVEFLRSHFQKNVGLKTVQIGYNSNYSQKQETFAFSLEDLEFNTVGSNKKDLIVTNKYIKELTNNIQCSREKIVKEMSWFFTKYVNDFMRFEQELQVIVKYTTLIDILQCKCYIANKFNYCKPIICNKDTNIGTNIVSKAFLSFTGIRHPLIEHLQTNELYVTNDLTLGKEDLVCPTGILLYGTNAVGKTSFIKSIGIALIMAQTGLYVPCKTFLYSPYNYIFTRILGNDNIFKGLSTFAVEMSELRTILKVADENSLVLGDELCSGTESDSALSIFTAGLESLHKKQSTFIFATHFHEINNYEEIKALENLKMLHMAVKYDRERNLLVYDRKLRDGPGESMYGLEVCKSLNLPDDFLKRAHDIRMKYNAKDKNILSMTTSHFNAQKIVGNCELCQKSPASEVHHLQHQQQARTDNGYIDTFHKNHVANLLNICDKCHKSIHKNSTQHKVNKTSKKYEINPL